MNTPSQTPMTPIAVTREAVSDAVKRLVIAESRLRIDSSQVAEDEPLNGPLLTVNSFGFVGMLVRLEDELGLTLADDVFVGRAFTTVNDLIDAIMAGAA